MYPVTKLGRFIPLKFLNESDISRDISIPNGILIRNYKNIYNIDDKALFYHEKFIEMIDYFIKLSPFYIEIIK